VFLNGDEDLLFYFKILDLNLDPNVTMAILVGETEGGLRIWVQDTVQIAP
jgi:hypothetical protein